MSTKVFNARSDYDGEEEWMEVRSWDHGDAAEDYARASDDGSGGEFADGTVVTVKEGDTGEPQQYAVSVDYEKQFTAYHHTPKAAATV